MKRPLLILALLPLGACAPKVLILQSPVVSMTKNNAGSAKELGEGKPVEEKWCSGDKPIKENDDGSDHYGMIDQVVLKAHKSTKADFFTNNRFYQQGTCVMMSANVGKGGGGDSSDKDSGSAPPKKNKSKSKKRK